MRDYIYQLFDSFSKKNESVEPKILSRSRILNRSKILNESVQDRAIEDILENLKYIKYDFEKKVLNPAMGLSINTHSDPLKGGDRVNPHVNAIYKVEDAIAHLEKQLKFQLQDPFKDAEWEESSDMDESDHYYRSMHPELSDDRGICSTSEEGLGDLSLDAPEVPMPIIIDEWEYLASDPEFGGNPTLLYDKNSLVVFIQKDSDPESEEPYYANGLLANGENLEFVSSDLDSLCQRLSLNEFPVPTEEAKAALKGMSVESVSESEEKKEEKEKLPKLPDGMKYAEDDQEISKVAPKVTEPKVANIEEPEKSKTRKDK